MDRGFLGAFEHASWRAAAGTALSYGAVLLVMFVILFIVPFGIFLLF
jgi:hypothetical protein